MRTRRLFAAGFLLGVLLGVGAVPAAQGGMWFVTNLIVQPLADTNINLVKTASGAQFVNVQTSTHVLGAVSGQWGTGAVTGSQVLAGRNSSGDGAAGTLRLMDAAGASHYLWIDATGDLRVGDAAPTEDGTTADTSGVIVGTQN
jgi:hypothetical protein